MLYCKKCGVSVDGNPDFCPLCQGELSGTAETGQKYPAVKHKKDGFGLAVKLAAMLTAAGVVACAFIDYCVSLKAFGWWLYVAAGAVSFWLPFGVAVKMRGNVAKSIFFTTVSAVLITFLWDLSTGYKGWSLSFVLPIAFMAAMLAVSVIGRILKLPIEQYIYYMILDIIFGIISVLLIIFGAVKFIPLLLSCMGVSLIFLAALLIFRGKALKDEIIRRTHL